MIKINKILFISYLFCHSSKYFKKITTKEQKSDFIFVFYMKIITIIDFLVNIFYLYNTRSIFLYLEYKK